MSSPTYFKALDGLRLLASLNIVLLHMQASWAFTEWKALTWWQPVIGAPAFTSSMFFVLAGFIYTHKLGAKAQSFAPWTFFVGRAKRLMPLHWLTAIAMILILGLREVNYWNDWEWLTSSILLHASLLWSFAPKLGDPLNQPSWALTAFFVCYASMGPMLKAVMDCQSRSKIILSMVALAIPLVAWTISYVQVSELPEAYVVYHVFPLMRIPEFLFGMLMARLQILPSEGSPICKETREAYWRDGAVVGVLLAIYLNVFLFQTDNVYLDWSSHHIVKPLLFGLLLWHLSWGKGLVCKLFSWRPIRIVGKASFYPYLLHVPLIGLTGLLFQDLMGIEGWLNRGWNAWLVILGLYAISTLWPWFRNSTLKKCTPQ